MKPRAWDEVVSDPDGGICWAWGPEIVRADPRAYMRDSQLRHWVQIELDGRRQPSEVRFDLISRDGGHSISPKPGDVLHMTGDRRVTYRIVEYREERSINEPWQSGWLLEWPD